MSHPPLGAPGGPPRRPVRRGRDNEAFLDDPFDSDAELRLLQLITSEGGTIELETLHYRTGLSSRAIRDWIGGLEEQGILKLEEVSGREVVSLRRHRG